MRRRPSELEEPALIKPSNAALADDVGVVLSGGGSRAAYQVGALKAISKHLESNQNPICVIVGSSIGAINSLMLGSLLKRGMLEALAELESVWLERTFRNTFAGSPSMAFLRSVKLAFLKYARDPQPDATSESIFDPTPLMNRIDQVILDNGGLTPAGRDQRLKAVAVMTTVEGSLRKPLLFVSSLKKLDEETMRGASFQAYHVDDLSAKHGFASAALPSVLPPVELDVEGGKVRLVDGGISQNVPVDPAVRMGAHRVVVIDISGRDWWLKHFGEPEDKRPTWEIEAGPETYCMRPPETCSIRCQKPLGPLLREAVGKRTSDFIAALGPMWPVFSLIKRKLGEEVAYETMSYVALHPEYSRALIERGYNECNQIVDARERLFAIEDQELLKK